MKYLKIQNNGLLPIRLVTLMGGTTKSKNELKIGQFGTGLKYTMAYLFRNNLDFRIFIGEEEVFVTTVVENIAGEDFEIIHINGRETSITTKMGEDWEAWMIVRELWCNAIDEGGEQRDVTTDPVGIADTTSFFIQVDSQIQKVLDDWSKYFIHDQVPIFENDSYALYPAGNHLTIYKQGVLIHESQTAKSVFSYDLKNADINELREYRGSVSHAITLCLHNCNEKAAEHFLESVTENHFEGSDGMDYNWYLSWSDAWKAAIGEAKLIHPEALKILLDRNPNMVTSHMVVVPKVVYLALTRQFPGISVLKVASGTHTFYEDYDEAIENKIKQGLVILEECDYPIHPELEFVYGFFEDKRIQAMVNQEEKKVYFSRTLLQKPLFTIVAVLIEENEHFNTGLSDETRAFQQHFIDLYTRTLLSRHAIEI